MAQPGRLGKRRAARHMPDMTKPSPKHPAPDARPPGRPGSPSRSPALEPHEEIGGPKGPEPTRYGDWEVGGRCTDF
jgi:Protein of unknown function (DUF1674)